MNFMKSVWTDEANSLADPPRKGMPASRRVLKAAAGVAMALAAGLGLALYLMRPVPVSVMHPVRGTVMDAVYATGTVEPTVMIPIAPRSSARLVDLLVDEGQWVTRGQTLALLEDDDLQRSVDEASAEEKYAAREYARLLQLVRKEAMPQAALDRAKANLDKATAARARADAAARYLTLVSPADGRVIQRDGEVGQLLTPASTVFWLTRDRALRVTAEVDEEEIGRLNPGQRVVLHADAFPGKTFEGQLQAITPKGDPTARSYRVRITLPADTPLMIGMTVETNIVVRTAKDAILVPSAAVQDNRVWVYADGQASQRVVTIGIKTATQAEVLSGIDAQDLLVARPPAGLREGDRLRAAP